MDILKKLIKSHRSLLLALAFSLLLSACGGGSDDESGSKTDENQWDAMVWDQGEWG